MATRNALISKCYGVPLIWPLECHHLSSPLIIRELSVISVRLGSATVGSASRLTPAPVR